VQALRVVLRDKRGVVTARVLDRRRGLRANGGDFKGLVKSFDSPVRLRIGRRGAQMRHAGHANEVAKVPRDELRPIVRDHARPRVGKLFLRPLRMVVTSTVVIDSRNSQCTR